MSPDGFRLVADLWTVLLGAVIGLHGAWSLATGAVPLVPAGALSAREARVFGIADLMLGLGLFAGSLIGLRIL